MDDLADLFSEERAGPEGVDLHVVLDNCDGALFHNVKDLALVTLLNNAISSLIAEPLHVLDNITLHRVGKVFEDDHLVEELH